MKSRVWHFRPENHFAIRVAKLRKGATLVLIGLVM